MHEAVRVSTTPNGVRVVTETVPGAVSVALGIWVECGSALETPQQNGASHFLEHMLFKGTERRSPRQIAESIECLGGSINAFTTKEHTCYHTTTLGADLRISVDVLCDMVTSSLLRPEDIELEREVIIQEILEAEDTPEDYVYDFHLEQYWANHALGRPVAGSVESVERLTRQDLVDFLSARYGADRVVVAAAGDVDHEVLLGLVEAGLSILKPHAAPLAVIPKLEPLPQVFVAKRDLEQVHMLIGGDGITVHDPRYETLEVLVSALGGGMSSRLFQNIREQRGRAYSIYAFESAFEHGGYTGVYAAAARENVPEVAQLILAELAEVAARGLEPDELRRAKTQLTRGVPLSMESTENRMSRIARNELYFRRDIPLAESMQRVEDVTNEGLVELATTLFAPNALSVALMGPATASMVSLAEAAA